MKGSFVVITEDFIYWGIVRFLAKAKLLTETTDMKRENDMKDHTVGPSAAAYQATTTITSQTASFPSSARVTIRGTIGQGLQGGNQYQKEDDALSLSPYSSLHFCLAANILASCHYAVTEKIFDFYILD
jgi:hypothetical protein